MTDVDTAAVVPRYYSAKTADILQKYGPGPRVHYHVGLFDPDARIVPSAAMSADEIRRQLVASQDATLDHAATVWRVQPGLRLLDVGCGLGGGAIYWAERYRAMVTALTNTPDHVPLVERFAAQAGVGDRIAPLLADAHTWRPRRRYDAAVAFESSGYIARSALFATVACALGPGGWFGVAEHFVRDPT